MTAVWMMSGLWFLWLGGCSAPFLRDDKAEEAKEDETHLAEIVKAPKLIGDVAVPFGLRPMKIEAVALVNGLQGTGSNPAPSPQLDMLKAEIQTHEIESVSSLLASPNTSMVFIRAILPAGAQKGDRIDIDVHSPPRSETTSLRGGWLMPARMREMKVLGNSLHEGSEAAIATGPVIVESLFNDDPTGAYQKRGRVLGGGVSLIDRPLGLVISNDFSSAQTSAVLGAAINDRFHRFDRGLKKGAATPKDDNFIEIALLPRYKHNVNRYLAVIRSLMIRETPRERLARLEELRKQLAEPISASRAALQLEAIGSEAVDVLKEGTRSADPNVRFHSAEALAYLDVADAAAPLAEAAVTQRQFRWRALLALAAMDQFSAYDSLVELLHAPGIETRYGAFYALRLRNPNDPTYAGEKLNDTMSLHHIPSTSETLIHFSRARRPEIVVFGMEAPIRPPAFLYAGPRILIKGTADGRLRVSQFAPGQETRVELCNADVLSMIRTIALLGGDFGDVLVAIQSAKASGDLDARLAVGLRPDRHGMRSARQDSGDDDEEEGSDGEAATFGESSDGEVEADNSTDAGLGDDFALSAAGPGDKPTSRVHDRNGRAEDEAPADRGMRSRGDAGKNEASEAESDATEQGVAYSAALSPSVPSRRSISDQSGDRAFVQESFHDVDPIEKPQPKKGFLSKIWSPFGSAFGGGKDDDKSARDE